MTDPVGSFSPPYKDIFLTGSLKFLGYFIECDGDSLGKYWSCKAQADLRIVNHKDPSKSLTRSINHLFYCKRSQYGYKDFIQWEQLTNPDKGFIMDDKITLEVDINVETPSKGW